MQFATAAVFLFAAMGAIANPVDSANGVGARGENGALITYTGTCTQSTQQCKYTGQNGRPTIVKCPTSPANHKCFGNGNTCTFDSYNRKVVCS